MINLISWKQSLLPNGKSLLLSLVFLAAINSLLFAQVPNNTTGSPHFLIKGSDIEKPLVDMPLKNTSASVSIAGVIADVKVRQAYINTGDLALDATYVFPGSSRSAVYGMTMTIGDRVIKAKIKEKEAAKKIFEKAKNQGKSASLLQQHRPNVFQMDVANILPGDTIIVEMSYTELLIPENGTYEFVYPTVVGPRYADDKMTQKDPWVLNPYSNPDALPVEITKPAFNIDCKLQTGMPIQSAKSPSHQVNISYPSKSVAEIALKNPRSFEGDRDFILQYKLSGDVIESGLLLFKGDYENFFLLMGQPPARITPLDIPPREYIFIVDVSGSMNGYPISISKSLMRDLFEQLKPTDKFNVMLFASASAQFSPRSLPANSKNLEDAFNFIDRQEGQGSTLLLPALERSLKMPHDDNYSRTVIIATDGYVTVEKAAFDLIRDNLGKANFFPFGIGASVNRYLIEGMARAGGGEPLIITNQLEARAKATQFRKYIESPVLTNIDVQFEGFNVYDVEPKSYPDIFAERPLIVFGKWRGDPSGKVKISGLSGTKNFSKEMQVQDFIASSDNEALSYLWARNKIMYLADYNRVSRSEELKKEITKLGLKYNLLTEYTSFVGVDNRNRMKEVIKTSSGSVPEPHEWMMIIFVAVTVLYFTFRRI